jgi:hypothetical protein
MKIVINTCYGGFGLSYAGVMAYAKRKNLTLYAWKNDPKNWTALLPYIEGTKEPVIHYTTAPLDSNHHYTEGTYWSDSHILRDDPDLIAVIEELGKDANGGWAELKVVEIPDGIDYQIDEYDGLEHIAEDHRTWY